jgi:hypothetical protein
MDEKVKPRHAAALALIALVTCSCLTSCSTLQVVQQTTVESQDRRVVTLTYKYGWFAPLGDDGQGNTIASEICIERGYSGATTLDQDERCLTHEWQIPHLFAACYGSLLRGSYYCVDAKSTPLLLPL